MLITLNLESYENLWSCAGAAPAIVSAALGRLAETLGDALEPLPGGLLVHDPAHVVLHRRVVAVTRLPLALVALLVPVLARLLGDWVEPGGLLPSPRLRASLTSLAGSHLQGLSLRNFLRLHSLG